MEKVDRQRPLIAKGKRRGVALLLVERRQQCLILRLRLGYEDANERVVLSWEPLLGGPNERLTTSLLNLGGEPAEVLEESRFVWQHPDRIV